jgi:hypothetical protein
LDQLKAKIAGLFFGGGAVTLFTYLSLCESTSFTISILTDWVPGEDGNKETVRGTIFRPSRYPYQSLEVSIITTSILRKFGKGWTFKVVFRISSRSFTQFDVF